MSSVKKQKVMKPRIPATGLFAKDSSGAMEIQRFERRGLRPCDVHIAITYSGICHSDIHVAKGEWGPKKYPLCVGHEILGKVVAVGDEVTKFKIGDLCGVGCYTNTCRKCDECKRGDESYCTGEGGYEATYGKERSDDLHPGGITQGGYSSDIVVDAEFVLKVHPNQHCAAAAPLLCAGITCYSPFRYYGLKAGMSLGVVGLGGLGHIAVKVAAAMGVEVTVISRSEKKKEMALAMGASRFAVSTDPEQMAGMSRQLDMIYDAVAFPHPVKPLLELLKSSGTIMLIGGVVEAMDVCFKDLLGRRLKLGGSLIGGLKETQEMLDFCSQHNIVADIELVEATPSAVEKAWDRAEKGDVKFRFVIDTAKTLRMDSAS